MLSSQPPPTNAGFPPPNAAGAGKRAGPVAATPTPAPALPPVNGTILVVDDSSVIRSAVTKVLLGRGHTVHQAENGRLGLEFWEQNKTAIQLVISDVFMPEMDGLKHGEGNPPA